MVELIILPPAARFFKKLKDKKLEADISTICQTDHGESTAALSVGLNAFR